MVLLRASLVFLALSVSLPSHAQTNAEKITHIKHLFAAINADKSYNKVIMDNEEVTSQATDGGIELTGYFKDDKLVKITEWLGVSNGNYITEYYLQNDPLDFVFSRFQMFAYTDSAGFDYTKMGDVVYEGRYYFDSNKLLDKAIKGDKEYDDRMTDCVADAKKYAVMLHKKKRSGK